MDFRTLRPQNHGSCLGAVHIYQKCLLRERVLKKFQNVSENVFKMPSKIDTKRDQKRTPKLNRELRTCAHREGFGAKVGPKRVPKRFKNHTKRDVKIELKINQNNIHCVMHPGLPNTSLKSCKLIKNKINI